MERVGRDRKNPLCSKASWHYQGLGSFQACTLQNGPKTLTSSILPTPLCKALHVVLPGEMGTLTPTPHAQGAAWGAPQGGHVPTLLPSAPSPGAQHLMAPCCPIPGTPR